MPNRLEQTRISRRRPTGTLSPAPPTATAAAMRRWAAQIGPLAVLAGAGYVLQALVAYVYRDFYEQLGVTPAEIDDGSQSGMIALIALLGLTLGVVVALTFPALSGFLAASATNHSTRNSNFLVAACLASSALPIPTAFLTDTTITKFVVVAETYATLGIMAGLLASSAIPPILAYLPPMTFIVSLAATFEVRKLVRGIPLLIISALVAAALATGPALLHRRADRHSRQPKAIKPRWHWSAQHQTAFAVGFCGIVALVTMALFVRLDTTATRAAQQVRTYGYIVDPVDGLDLWVRPITVRVLGKDDPLGLCSTSAPAALTQVNRDSGEPIVLFRYLNPVTLTPDPNRSPEVMRLPTDNYVIVQHLSLWTPGKHSDGPPQPWATPACPPLR